MFGRPEIAAQLVQMIDYPEFWDAWSIVAGEPETGDCNRLLNLIESLELAGQWVPRE